MSMGYMAHSATRAKINQLHGKWSYTQNVGTLLLNISCIQRLFKEFNIYSCMHVEHRSLFPRRSLKKP